MRREASWQAPSFKNMLNSWYHFKYLSLSFLAWSCKYRNNFRTTTSWIFASNRLSWDFSREIDKGRSSLSTTPFTKRHHSGAISLQGFSIKTFLEYSPTDGSSLPNPPFSVWNDGMNSTHLMSRGASARKWRVYVGGVPGPLEGRPIERFVRLLVDFSGVLGPDRARRVRELAVDFYREAHK